MPLPTYPPAPPAPSPTFAMFERGQQNYLLVNQGAVQTFTGTALPAGSTALGVPPSRVAEEAISDFTIQLDAFGTPGAVVHLLGSLDGVNFYDLGAVQAAGTYGVFFSSKLITPGVKLRYISAYVSAYAGSGGTTDSITVSIYA